tara:strand:- start:80 stop:541 length:462 start_codon:yes stop_codon:yes gene_type:complete
MAGDKKTILDVVKKAGKGQAAGGDVEFDYYTHPARMVDQALYEKNPTAGGTYEGSVYYSNILPQGKGDIPWTKESATIIKNASQSGAKKSDILAAQNYFVDIGYMHPSEVDGKPGKQFHGMISRWNKNAGVSKEAMFDAMETWKDNIFSRDKE